MKAEEFLAKLDRVEALFGRVNQEARRRLDVDLRTPQRLDQCPLQTPTSSDALASLESLLSALCHQLISALQEPSPKTDAQTLPLGPAAQFAQPAASEASQLIAELSDVTDFGPSAIFNGCIFNVNIGERSLPFEGKEAPCEA